MVGRSPPQLAACNYAGSTCCADGLAAKPPLGPGSELASSIEACHSVWPLQTLLACDLGEMQAPRPACTPCGLLPLLWVQRKRQNNSSPCPLLGYTRDNRNVTAPARPPVPAVQVGRPAATLPAATEPLLQRWPCCMRELAVWLKPGGLPGILQQHINPMCRLAAHAELGHHSVAGTLGHRPTQLQGIESAAGFTKSLQQLGEQQQRVHWCSMRPGWAPKQLHMQITGMQTHQ